MSLLNVPKLIVAVMAMICVTGLTIAGKVSGEAAVAVISSVLAYILGNGVAAMQGKPVTPIIAASPARQARADAATDTPAD